MSERTTDILPRQLKSRDQERMAAYKANLDFYQGKQWPSQSRRERQLTFNYARVAVDKVTSYLMSGLDFAVEPASANPSAIASAKVEATAGQGETAKARAAEASARARLAEDAIYAVYRENGCEALDYDTEVDAAILGDGCYKVTWDAAARRVRITAPDPQNLWAWYRADDPSQVYRVAARTTFSAEEYAARTGEQIAQKYIDIVEDWTSEALTVWAGDRVINNSPNPYGFVPFVVFPNIRQPKSFWGQSDIPTIMETQRELNRALSQLSRILEVSGSPIAVLENVEDSQDIAIQPNAVWNIPEGAKAYLLDLLQGGGMRLHIDYIDLLYRTMHDLSETPRAAFGGVDKELSGVALEMELNPLLQKVKRKRTIRTAVYRRRNEMVLALLAKFGNPAAGLPEGGFGPEGPFGHVTQRIVWGQVLPQDNAKIAQSEQQLVQSGIHSRRRAMDDLGVMDPEAEFNRWMEERQRIMEQNNRLQARFAPRGYPGGPRERASAAQPAAEAPPSDDQAQVAP